MTPAEARAAQARAMPEADLQTLIIELAKVRGWLLWRDNYSQRNRPGWPDLVLCRRGRLLFLELKSETGRVRPEQAEWLEALRLVTGVEVHVVRPSAWLSGAIPALLA